jgi:hypothetical protein
MRKLLIAPLFFAPFGGVLAQCPPSTGHNFLDINNVRARINIAMGHWWDELGSPEYEVPQGGGAHALFAGALWIGGVDEQDSLRLSAVRFRQIGDEYWPGPLSVDGAMPDTSDCERFDRVWKVTKWQVAEFRQRFNEPGYVIPQDILEWPAHGNFFAGHSFTLAPFVDVNGNGTYEPLLGDYPAFVFDGDFNPDYHLPGDQVLWWIVNDRRDIFQPAEMGESNGLPIGMEMHCTAYAFRRCDALNDQTFYRYKAINRGQHTLSDTYFGKWVDVDLGFAQDDYVGCDVGRSMGYGYNGNVIDGTGGPLQYGVHPPALGIDILRGTVAGSGEAPSPFTSMARFLYHNNDASVIGDPHTAQEYYNYMRGVWRDGTPMCYGGNGHPSSGCNAGLECHYMFPGDTDPLGIGTGGMPQATWTEQTAGNLPFDRRFLMSSGPFTFAPGDTAILHLAAVYGRTDSDSDPVSIIALQEADDLVQAAFDADFQNLSCCPPDAAVSFQRPETFRYLFASIAEGDSYLWDFGDGDTSTERFPMNAYPAYGTYTVCLTVTNACGSDTHCQAINIEVGSTSVSEEESIGLVIHPNPTSHGFHVRLKQGVVRSVKLTDALGRTVAEVAGTDASVFVTTAGLAPGLYIATVVTDNGQVARRVVVE